jgi:membrane protein YdbS with pleckstrin-like domain
MNKLHPGAKWLFRINALVAMIPIAFVLFYLLSVARFFTSFFEQGGMAPEISYFVIPVIIGLIVLALIVAEVYSRLAYNNWAYEFGDDALKLERGIIWKKYTNVPYERVQNVDVNRGILARLMGFSTLNIQTAGAAYGNRGSLTSEGHIPAVEREHAEKIRDFLIKKISKKSAAGL